uniref:PA domain-containing protein n=1 Tax=Calcidiscus leptoporus TaxID=127549 RepID=A0A7S0IUW2_9EUKA
MGLTLTREAPRLKLLILGADTSNFTLVLSTPQSNVPLTNGMPKRFECPPGQYRYFSAAVFGNAAVSIVVTPLTGDPDVYVSTSVESGKPDSTNSQWSSLDNGNRYEHILISPEDPSRCSNVAQCTFYIGVLARTATTYAISVTWGGTPVHLLEGMPQAGQITEAMTTAGQLSKQFLYRASGSHADLAFSLTMQYGVAHMYVATDGPASATHSQWNSQHLWTGNEKIRIAHTDANFCAACDYHVAVVVPDAASSASFTLSAASSGALTVLEDGTPMTAQAVAAGEYEYYKLFVSQPAVDLQIIMTAFTGNPDLFVSTTSPKPNATNYEASSQDGEGDIIKINHQDQRLIACQAQRRTCVVYMAVLGVDGNAQYSLLASSFPVSSGFHVDLPAAIAGDVEFTTATFGRALPQRPLSQFVAYAQPHHACGAISNAAELTGMVALVDRGPSSDECPMPHRYFANKVLAVQDVGAVAVVMVNNRENAPLVYMGAVSGDHAARVNIPSVFVSKETGDVFKQQLGTGNLHVSLSKPSGRLPMLTPGNPQRGATLHSQFMYYEIWTPPGRDTIVLTVTPQFGNPDVFVSSNGALPSTMYFDWTSETAGSESLTIRPDDPKACRSCRYYVGVLGASSSSAFVIQYTLNESLITLQAGAPVQNVEVAEGGYKFFRCFVDTHSNAGLTFSVTVTSGDADLFVSFDVERPTKEAHTWAAEGRTRCQNVDCGDSISSGDAVYTPATDKTFCQTPCLAYIGVYGAVDSVVSVLFTFDSVDTPVVLSDGVPQHATMTYAGSYDYYTFSVGEAVDSFELSVIPTAGDPDLYVSSNASMPSRDRFMWRSTEGGALQPHSESIVIPTAGPTACIPCTYKIAVYAWSPDISYSITATSTNGTRLLAQGEPATGKAAAGKYRFYRYFVRTAADIELTLTDFAGNPTLYTWFNSNPTADKSKTPSEVVPAWALSSSQPVGPEFLLIGQAQMAQLRHAAPGAACELPCTLYAAVRAETDSSYSLLIKQNALPTPLINGQPQAASLRSAAGSHSYTFVAKKDLLFGVVFSLAAYAGFPSFSVRWASGGPLTGNASSPVRLGGCIPSCDSGEYTVDVRGGPADYAITANKMNTYQLLQDRTPVQANLKTKTSAFYKIDVPEAANGAVLYVTPFSGSILIKLWDGRYSTEYTATATQTALVPLQAARVNAVEVTSTSSQSARDTSFTLLALLTDGMVVLTDGSPSSVEVATLKPETFGFAVSAGESITITAVPGDLSASAQISLSAKFSTSGVSRAWRKSGSAGDVVTLFVPAPVQGACAAAGFCMLSLNLSATVSANVTITATSVGAVAQLPLDQPLAKSAKAASSAQYVVILDPDDPDDDSLVFDLQVCEGKRGDLSLFVAEATPATADFHIAGGVSLGDADAPLELGEESFAGKSKAFVGVAAASNASFTLQVRKRTTPPAAGSVRLADASAHFEARLDTVAPALHLTFAPLPEEALYEVWVKPTSKSGREATEQFLYWCGVQHGGALLLHDAVAESGVEALGRDESTLKVPLVPRGEVELCPKDVSEGQPCLLNNGSDFAVVLVARVPVEGGRPRHLLYDPCFLSNGGGGGGGKGGGLGFFGWLMLLMAFSLVGWTAFWAVRRKKKGEHLGADKETLKAYGSETAAMLATGAAKGAELAKAGGRAAVDGFNWSRGKIGDYRASRARVSGGDSMTAPLACSAAPLVMPGALPALAVSSTASTLAEATPVQPSTEPLQLVMAAPLPPDDAFASAHGGANMFGDPVVASPRHAGMD